MENFSVLGSLALRLHQEFVSMYYLLLPVFFALALVMDWFRNPAGSVDFLDTLKRAFVATLLVVAFQEISDAILTIASGIADKIDDMSGLDAILQMAGEKARSYTLSPMSLVLGFNDLVVAIITFPIHGKIVLLNQDFQSDNAFSLIFAVPGKKSQSSHRIEVSLSGKRGKPKHEKGK